MNNQLKTLPFLAIALLLTGCISTDYKPGHYSLDPDRIPSLTVKGQIQYLNDYQEDVAGVVEESGNKYHFSYQAVTDAFNRQLKHEVSQRTHDNNNLTEKIIRSKVTYIHCAAGFGSYVRNCQFTVELQTGDGQSITVHASQNSPIFNAMNGSLNGTIATGVIETLENRRILGYLAAESADLVSPGENSSLAAATAATIGAQGTAQTSSASGVDPSFDWTGKYVSERIPKRWIFKKQGTLRLQLTQNGDELVGNFYRNLKGAMRGTVIDNTAEVTWETDNCASGEGTLTANPQADQLTGTLLCRSQGMQKFDVTFKRY